MSQLPFRCMGCIIFFFFISICYCKVVTVSNTVLPVDNNGNPLITGELDVLEWKGTYYFFMNNWGGCPGVNCCTSSGGCASCCFNPPTSQYPDACVYTTNHTVEAYSTTDFVNWLYLGVALNGTDRLEGIEFRPHVLFNAKNNLFVMWYEDRWSGQTGYAVAVSSVPEGPYKTVNNSVVLSGSGRVGDYDLFVDDDGTAYHVRTGIVIEKLNADYTAGSGEIYSVTNTGVEGPAMFKRNGTYYVLVGLGCCACIGGSNIVVYSGNAPLGPYTLIGDVGSNSSQSFNAFSPLNYVTHAQQSKVFTVPDSNGDLQYVWVGNQWVTSSLPGRPRNNDLLYWSILEFDSHGNIQQFVHQDNTTISLPI